jgi:hypothetical protein
LRGEGEVVVHVNERTNDNKFRKVKEEREGKGGRGGEVDR